jgi:hypothetical protein
LLAAGVASLAVATVAGAMLYLRADAPAPMPAPSEPETAETWKVVGATTAHGVLVVDVEVIDPEEADAIAVQIVEPVRSHDYQEILIYFYPPGRPPGGDALRRMLWTPDDGFVETTYVPGGP